MSIKARFTFVAESSITDPRTTVVNLRYFQPDDDDSDLIYAFPLDRVSLDNHDKLMQLTSAKTAKKGLTARGKKRTARITLPPDVAALYLDSDGNPVFQNEMLDEYIPTKPPSQISSLSEAVRINSDEQPITIVQPKPLSTILKDAVLSNFGAGSKSMNALAWLNLFESECLRLKVPVDRFWEALRLFLEKSPMDWYNTTRLKTTSTDWDFWKESFLQNFGQKGWSDARSAVAFRFIAGSLAEYAQTKVNLLVSFNPKMDDLTLISLVVIGLPFHIQDRLDKVEITSIGKLISKINSFDRPSPRTISNNFSSSVPPSPFASLKRAPCSYCKSKGFERYHAEKDCLTKEKDLRFGKNNFHTNKNFTQNSNVMHKQTERKAINNVEVNDLVNEILEESKNA